MNFTEWEIRSRLKPTKREGPAEAANETGGTQHGHRKKRHGRHAGIQRCPGHSRTRRRPGAFVHETFAPTPKEIAYAEKLVRGCQAQADAGIGVYTVDGKMVDIPFFEDAKRIIALAKACGVYHGDL